QIQGESRGLGIVAFEIDERRRPALFVANDQVANFFLINRPGKAPHNLELQNEALVTGLAYNENGLAMACMGVATGDWNQDGLLDLFVTNFENESNTVYL